MVIEYQIKRFDPVKSYFFNLRHSRRTRIIVFGTAAIVVIVSLLLRNGSHSPLVLPDFIVSFLSGLGLILFIPLYSFLTAKTQVRTLSISQDGIETKIGRYAGKIHWSAVDSIVATQDRIFITGKAGNTFTIPSGAFATGAIRQEFITLATQYHSGAAPHPPD
jgi:hypothetical protein